MRLQGESEESLCNRPTELAKASVSARPALWQDFITMPMDREKGPYSYARPQSQPRLEPVPESLATTQPWEWSAAPKLRPRIATIREVEGQCVDRLPLDGMRTEE
jgi:hypothetical protein